MSFNDPQWGRSTGSDKPRNDEQDKKDTDQSQPARRDDNPHNDEENRSTSDNTRNSRNQPRNDRDEGNDLDQLWNDFNRMLNSVLGGKDKDPRHSTHMRQDRRDNDSDARNEYEQSQNGWSRGDDFDNPPPPPKRPRSNRGFGRDPKAFSLKGLSALVGIAVVGWLATGIYIVPEGQIGVVTTFGKYTQDSAAGINWRLPWPIQRVEIVDVSSVRKAEIGMRGTTQRLKEALMLTDDENIVDVMFNVQYRIKPHAAKEYLFRSRDPDRSVFDAAESAMREVVGRKTMDSVLFESKQEIASAVQVAMQSMLDRYRTGIEVMSVAIQNAQPPQQVQAAFNDAVKAGQDRERQINEGQAYANAVVPVARGMASRLVQEAEAYKARVVETAHGDAERFSKVLEQYEKAPQVTRDRIYIDAMRDVYSNTKKVLVETKGSSNLLYLPFDKLLEQSASAAASGTQPSTPATGTAATVVAPATQSAPQQNTARTLIRDRVR